MHRLDLERDADHPGSLAVLMSGGEAGSKHMKLPGQHITYRDVTGHWPDPITTDENGEAEFKCQSGSVSVWCAC